MHKSGNMNSSKKVRCLDTFPRVRKRRSTGNKPASHSSYNAVQRRASLLKNNKSLALTLQETRCELSSYKSFYEESLEYINKTKLVKSRMVVLSATLKNLLQAFEENLVLLDFDESILTNVKAAAQSNKILQNGMNPVLEAANEVMEEVFADQEMNYDDENSPESSGQMSQNVLNLLESLEKDRNEEITDTDSKSANKSPQKKSEDVAPKNDKSLGPETKKAKGNEDEGLEVPNFSLNKCSELNSVQNPPVTVKEASKTKIPRCQGLTVNQKRQNIFKGSKSPNKASKRKSMEKNCEESGSNFSRRKTFVVKSNHVVLESGSSENLTGGFQLDEGMNIPEDQLISKNDKRQTFVIKKKNILKETEPVVYLNKIDDRKFATDSRVSGDETTDKQSAFNKRKTFVKRNKNKITLQESNDTSESDQTSFPNRGCAVNSKTALTITENGKQNEDWISSCDAEFNHSETNATVKNKLKKNYVDAVNERAICNDKRKPPNSPPMNENTNQEYSPLETQVPFFQSSESDVIKAIESSINREHSAEAPLKEIKEIGKVSVPYILNTRIKKKELSENIKSTIDSVVSDQITAEAAIKDVDAVSEITIFSDKQKPNNPSMNENAGKECHSRKTRRSFLESSESELDLIVLDEFDFGDARPALQKTPIRRQISKSKKKKFVFDANKKKPALKKNSSNKIMKNEINDNPSQESNVVHLFDADVIMDNEIKERDDVISSSNGPLNTDNDADIPSNVCTLGKQTKKIKDKQSTHLKSNSDRKANKTQKVRKNKKNPSNIEVDDLSRKPLTKKKKNSKKNNNLWFDDNAISKFVDVDKTVKVKDIQGTDKDAESDFLCKKTGKNTFLVRAEVHPPPPSFSIPKMKETNKENDKLGLPCMQLAVVLSDVLKLKDYEHLNISDKMSVPSSKPISEKTPLSGSVDNFAIDPEESIEKLRCDLVSDTDDYDLYSDTIMDAGCSEVPSDPLHDIENPRGRRKKEVNYKEPSLHRKMRRC